MVASMLRSTVFVLGILALQTAHTQDAEAGLTRIFPSYTEDFLENTSFPAVGFKNAWQDSTGRLWLPTSPIVSSERLHMFTFNGYEFKLVKGPLNALKPHATITAQLRDIVFCGLAGEREEKELFVADLKSKQIDSYALPEYTRVHDPITVRGVVMVLTENAGKWNISTLDNKTFTTQQLTPPDRLRSHTLAGDSKVSYFDGKEIWVSGSDTIWSYHIQTQAIRAYHISQSGFVPERIRVAIAGERPYAIARHASGEVVFWLDERIGKFVPVPQVKGEFRNIKIFADSVGNTFINCTDHEKQHHAWLRTSDNKWLDYSAFVEPLYGSGMDNVIGRDFRRQMLICHSAGLLLQKVSLNDGIRHYLHDRSIRAMTQLSESEILVTVQNEDKFVLDLQTDQVRLSDIDPAIVNRRYLHPTNSRRWVGMQDGIALYDKAFSERYDEFKGIGRVAFVVALGRSSIGFYEIEAGISILNTITREVTPLTINDEQVIFSGVVYDLYASDSTTLWGVTSTGLWKVDLKDDEVRVLGEEDKFTDSRFLCIHPGDDGRLWLGSVVGGIQIYDPETGGVQVLDNGKGLRNNTIVSIERDKDGNRWAATYNGISILTPDGELIANLNVQDGIVHRESNRYASLLTDDGLVLIGTVAGLNVIDPVVVKERIRHSDEVHIYLSSLSWTQKNKEQVHLNQMWEEGSFSHLKLPATQRSLRVAFALSNVFNAAHHQYTYRLESRDSEWRPLGNQHFLEFDDLTAGHYTLFVRGTDATGQASVNTLAIPFTARAFLNEHWWFYPLCILLVASLSLLLILRLRAEIRKATQKIRNDKELIEQQAEELQELDKAKSRFFTNISHEFRTPLTIISGMAAQILSSPEIWAEKGARMIRKSSNSLMEMVNQILDLRKLEASEMQLQMVQGDLIVYLRYLVDSFRYYVDSEGKQLHFLSRPQEFVMDYDPEKMLQIISNLITNAIKHTPSGTDIYVQIDQEKSGDRETFLLTVQDTGQGIAQEKLPHIFDRFFQADNSDSTSRGTGIGLALTKELVQLMHGTIHVESTPGEGTRFEIALPVSRSAGVSAQVTFPSLESLPLKQNEDQPIENEVAGEKDLPRVLIVEDNADIIHYLTLCLQPAYQLLYAANGQEGIETAVEQVPDIIISDVMMPEMDGFELCETLKQDPHTDHIPIILLTAKADKQSRISGLKHGADDYLTKPFEPEELLQRIENLLATRKSLQERYSSRDRVQSAKENPSPQDAFVISLFSAVEEHLDDAEFGVVQLCRAVGLGRSQLHSKLKALTGMSATIFIRHVRLLRAQELLKTTDLNVSEVAYEVGFNDPRFFTRVYTEKFGEPPSRTRK